MNESAKQLTSDKKLLTNSKYVEQVREMISFLGSDPDTVMKEETDKNIKLLMEAKSLVDVAYNSDLFQRDEVTKQYSVLSKISAIAVLTGSLAIKNKLGLNNDPIPYYTAVSEWINIPEETLRRWWRGRDLMKTEIAALSYSSVMRSSFKQMTLIEDITDIIKKNVNFEEMVKTPAGLNATTKTMGQLYFLMLGMRDVGNQLKQFVDGGEGEHIEVRNIGIVTPEPITQGKKDGSSTDKG